MEEYFKKQKTDISKVYNITKSYQYSMYKTQDDRHIIKISDLETNKLVIKAEYTVAGVYSTKALKWFWGYDLEFVDKSSTTESKVVRNIKSDSSFNAKTDDVLQCIKLLLYLIKGVWYVQIPDKQKERVEYLIIKKLL